MKRYIKSDSLDDPRVWTKAQRAKLIDLIDKYYDDDSKYEYVEEVLEEVSGLDFDELDDNDYGTGEGFYKHFTSEQLNAAYKKLRSAYGSIESCSSVTAARYGQAPKTVDKYQYHVYCDRGSGMELSAWYDSYGEAKKTAAFLKKKGYDVEIRDTFAEPVNAATYSGVQSNQLEQAEKLLRKRMSQELESGESILEDIGHRYGNYNFFAPAVLVFFPDGTTHLVADDEGMLNDYGAIEITQGEPIEPEELADSLLTAFGYES